jgi:hypothetical protein
VHREGDDHLGSWVDSKVFATLSEVCFVRSAVLAAINQLSVDSVGQSPNLVGDFHMKTMTAAALGALQDVREYCAVMDLLGPT